MIEIDGDSHALQEEYDRARTEWLEDRGFKVIRFTNQDVFQHLADVIKEIVLTCTQRLTPNQKETI